MKIGLSEKAEQFLETFFPSVLAFEISSYLEYETLNLGHLIDKIKKNKELPVLFEDDETKYPCGFLSYRGIYRELSITYKDDLCLLELCHCRHVCTCEHAKLLISPTGLDFFTRLCSCLGKFFIGYKGAHTEIQEIGTTCTK